MDPVIKLTEIINAVAIVNSHVNKSVGATCVYNKQCVQHAGYEHQVK